MEEEKAAAYYDELTRKGEGAARFKQGLGFASQSSSDAKTDNAAPPPRGSALASSSSSFLSSFVRASSPGKTTAILEKQAQLENIQNKLNKKQRSEHHEPKASSDHHHRSRDDSCRKRRRYSSSRERDRHLRRRSRDDHDSRLRYRSSSRERGRDKRDERRRRRRSRSRSYSDEEKKRRRRYSREGRGSGRRSRSSSPRERTRSEKSRSHENSDSKSDMGIDYSRLIEGYAEMTAAEKVKAKMKLQLTQTAKKDSAIGTGVGWERFEFDKDAPLDDEEIEAADDDKVLVKHIGQSFRFSAVEARREEEIKAAHDKAMFGAPATPLPTTPDEVLTGESDKKESNDNIAITNLISEKVLTKQQGSWRDRARKLLNGPTS